TMSGKLEQRFTAPLRATLPGAVGVYWKVSSLSVVGYHTPTFKPPSCITRNPTESGVLQLAAGGPGEGDGPVGVDERLHPAQQSTAASRQTPHLTNPSYTADVHKCFADNGWG